MYPSGSQQEAWWHTQYEIIPRDFDRKMTLYKGVGMRELQKTVQKFGISSNKAVTILRPKRIRKGDMPGIQRISCRTGLFECSRDLWSNIGSLRWPHREGARRILHPLSEFPVVSPLSKSFLKQQNMENLFMQLIQVSLPWQRAESGEES